MGMNYLDKASKNELTKNLSIKQMPTVSIFQMLSEVNYTARWGKQNLM